MIIVWADDSEGDSLRFLDTNAKAQVGRWCRPPETPDLCFHCFNPKTLGNYPAEGYIETDGWRLGTCHRCSEEE